MDSRALRSTFGNAKAANRRISTCKFEIDSPFLRLRFRSSIRCLSANDLPPYLRVSSSAHTTNQLHLYRSPTGHSPRLYPTNYGDIPVSPPYSIYYALRNWRIGPRTFRTMAIELWRLQHMLRIGQNAFVFGRTRIGRTFLGATRGF